VDQDSHRSIEDCCLVALRVIPVIDLHGGHAVHARGGLRATYQAVESTLCPGHDPLELARAYRDRLGLEELYLADLDAIEGAPADLDLVRRLNAERLGVWLDAGLQDGSSLEAIESSGASTVIAASETLLGCTQLAELARRARPRSLVFGLDLKAGRPVVAPASLWPSVEPRALIEEALAVGLERVLILDTSRVGAGRGVGTLTLVNELLRDHPDLEVSVGGGIAGRSDLRVLEALGVSAALVGSALHDGRIGRGDLHRARQ
jgi:phosphoribosylformimino-5-aminoimidazole carboxamide ribotide isomerase